MSPGEETAALRRDVDRHEGALGQLWSQKASLRDLEQVGKDFEALADQVHSLRGEMKDEQRSTRRTLIAFAFTIAASSITVAFAVLGSGGPS